jgi:hypothetical protein
VAHGDGWRVPPRPASFFAVNAADAGLGGPSVHDAPAVQL